MPARQPNPTGPVDPVTTPDPRALRRCFGQFTTGVTVLSYRVGDQVRGATVNSFTSVSVDPPLLLVALARSSQACTALPDARFTVNVLRSDQMDVAWQFAGRPRPGLTIAWDPPRGAEDPPVLTGAVAVFRCRPWRNYDGGDHVLHLGEITDFELRGGDPLVFGDGRFVSTGLPILDGPLIYSFDGPPRPGWVGAAHRLHALPEH
ncbi:MAG: flavin reductase family protein [Pseudonocardia sp.]